MTVRDHTTPRCRERRRVAVRLPRRAPCRWAAAWRCERSARVGKAAGGRPGAGGRIIQLRACKPRAVGAQTSRDEHLAVGQQRGGVTGARGAEAAGGRPGAGGRIIQLRAGQNGCRSLTYTSRDEHLAVGQQRGGVTVSRAVARLPVDDQVPVAGSYSSALSSVAEVVRRCLPRRAPCRWAAAWPCERSARCRGCR